MDTLRHHNPIAFFDAFRGKDFTGEWPTIPEMVDITVQRFPDNACFTDFEGPDGSRRTLTFTQVRQGVLQLARWLAANGVRQGDRVAVSGKNSPEWGTVYLAALYAGAIICPIDYALRVEEQENLLAVAAPKFLFVDEEKYAYYAGKVNAFRVYSLCPTQGERYVYSLRADKEPVLARAAENDTAAILFTSGTTGAPKGVMLSHRNLVSDCYIAQYHLKVYSTDVFYALLPLHHAYTMLAVFLEALALGSEVVFGKSMAVPRIMSDLREGKITMLMGVPLLYNKVAAGIIKGIRARGPVVYGAVRLLMAVSYLIKKVFRLNPGKVLFKSVLTKANLYTVRIAICGGGPLDKGVFRLYNQMGINFVQGYGLTETSPIIALNPIEHFKIESVGKYFVGAMEMRIADPSADGVGEIQVKGPMVMQGYYKMPQATAEVFTEDGWFKTGDLGWLDKENYLMLSGRLKNMIVTEGGKNVYPEEIEDMFQLKADIQQITVQGYIANEATRSEELEALVYPSDELFARLGLERGGPDAMDAVRREVQRTVNEVNRNLLPYQRITKVTLLDEPLEMTTTLKVKRASRPAVGA